MGSEQPDHTRGIRELKAEHFGVPAGIQGDLVIAAGYLGRLIAGEEVGVKLSIYCVNVEFDGRDSFRRFKGENACREENRSG